ncbi:MAG: hypothetical protein A3J38_07690 [Gammaproteobacteria bacterium RIFCSPHIGHO2_12_FULL_45_9]|nr:MAG: hypothetical protein A3J38_07690 [Gammaproteobacteria bacterium RIFCSPHIGHO2_12_FULL_45_9]
MWGDRAKNGKEAKQSDAKRADHPANPTSTLLTPAQAVAVTPPPSTVSTPTATHAALPAQSAHVPSVPRSVSTFGPSVVFQGTLRANEDVVIFGAIKGDVHLPNNIVTVEKGGRIDGNILAKGVHIAGETTGDVFAQYISVKKAGSACGNLVAPKVVIEESALFKGNVDMDSQRVEEKLAKLEAHGLRADAKNSSSNAEHKATHTTKELAAEPV